MNKFILTSLAMIGLSLSLVAQTVTIATIGASSGTNAIAVGVDNTNFMVTRVTVISATANIVRFYDAYTNAGVAANVGITALSYTNGAYTNWLSASFTNIVTFTNSLGRTQQNSYIGLSNYAAIVAAGSNSYPIIGTIAVAAGTPYSLPVNWNVTRQLWIAGTNAATVAIEYQ